MADIMWAKKIPAVAQHDEFGALVFDDDGDVVYEQQFFKTKNGELIPVPPDGFIIRAQGRKDYAVTKDELVADFKRFRFGKSAGYPAGKPTRWRRYVKR